MNTSIRRVLVVSFVDLYYRLSVFPIAIPPLRLRLDDIPLLVAHFVEKFAQQMSKQISKIPIHAMETLVRHPWPGNIRELQNLIERAVILTRGDVLQVPSLPSVTPIQTGPVTLAEADRDHIPKALEESNWAVGGRSGAAVRLGIKRTTLLAKMKKLGFRVCVTRRGVDLQWDERMRFGVKAGGFHLDSRSGSPNT
jgi:formate hydrogenlyase transcriptional activator